MQSKSRLEELKNKELDELADALEDQRVIYNELKSKSDDEKKKADKKLNSLQSEHDELLK